MSCANNRLATQIMLTYDVLSIFIRFSSCVCFIFCGNFKYDDQSSFTGVNMHSNHSHNKLRLLDFLPNFTFTSSETKPDY